MAASATFALKVAVWFRRGRLFMVYALIRWAQRARCQAETPLIALFRFSETSSHDPQLAVLSPATMPSTIDRSHETPFSTSTCERSIIHSMWSK